MHFTPPPPGPTRIAAAVLTILLGIGVSAAAGAATPDAAVPESPRAAAIEEWKGRFCTAAGCRDVPASPLSAAASFGAAILAIGWFGRHRAAPAPTPSE